MAEKPQPDLVQCCQVCEANTKEADKVADQLESTGISSAEGASVELQFELLLVYEEKEVVVEKVVHNKRKCITTIKSLDLFGEPHASLCSKRPPQFWPVGLIRRCPT
ncbi:hypothetical protein DITRI_Ditri03aG0053000 [Diplodiscus trichospermus]